MKKKKKKIRIPKSILELRLSPKKFAKKHGIRIKGVGKRLKKRNMKRLKDLYSRAAIDGLNKAVKILSDHPNEDGKKIDKIKGVVDKIITNEGVMKKVSKIYKKKPDEYSNLVYLPHMIINTLLYYSQEGLSEKEQEIGQTLDKDSLINFCHRVLKSRIKKYKKYDLSEDTSFKLAEVIPTTKLLVNNRMWFKKLIQSLYVIADSEEVDYKRILRAVLKVDKKRHINKNDFYKSFYSEFILTKASNRNHSFTDTQKDLHESLIEGVMEYIESSKPSTIRDILKTYIKRRKTAESYKNDTRRVITFIDYANSNSSFVKIKKAIQDLVADNSTNELYLS